MMIHIPPGVLTQPAKMQVEAGSLKAQLEIRRLPPRIPRNHILVATTMRDLCGPVLYQGREVDLACGNRRRLPVDRVDHTVSDQNVCWIEFAMDQRQRQVYKLPHQFFGSSRANGGHPCKSDFLTGRN